MKEKKRHHRSTIARATAIQRIVQEHYEPGNNARCLKQVWRHHVWPVYGCCYMTFLSYLGMTPLKPDSPDEDPRQLRLF